jgi:hypothetical protein
MSNVGQQRMKTDLEVQYDKRNLKLSKLTNCLIHTNSLSKLQGYFGVKYNIAKLQHSRWDGSNQGTKLERRKREETNQIRL